MTYLNHYHAVERLESSSPVLHEENDVGFHMSNENIEQFLENCRQDGCTEKQSLKYANGLKNLYDFLPEDKIIWHGTLKEWRDNLINKGYVYGTVNNFLKYANQYLQFFGQREYQMLERLENLMDAQPELSRAEYLRLLKTAKEIGNERAYLMIKL